MGILAREPAPLAKPRGLLAMKYSVGSPLCLFAELLFCARRLEPIATLPVRSGSPRPVQHVLLVVYAVIGAGTPALLGATPSVASTRKSARTTFSFHCMPAPRRNSSITTSKVSAWRYGLSDVIAS